MFATSKSKKAKRARVPDGERVYAVGDIHGRLDLFEALKDAIEADVAEAEEAGLSAQIVLLGDLVDRGPDSAGVIELARKWAKKRDVRILFGNHEEMFVRSFDDADMMKHFLRHGGRETLQSYGIERKAFAKATISELQAMMAEIIPGKHRKFLKSFEDMIRIGSYVFVHAGIEPGIPLDEQKARTLRWVREPFLSHKKPHEAVVVHGHTITEGVVDTGNRIGIDTGAYQSGRLTALVLEGKSRRTIAAIEGKKGEIAIETKSLGG